MDFRVAEKLHLVPAYLCPPVLTCACALKYRAEQTPWSVKCQEFCLNGSVSLLCQWHGFDRAAGCKRPTITSRPRQRFLVRALAASSSRRFYRQEHVTGRQNNLPQTLHRMWMGNTPCIHCFSLGSSFTVSSPLCPFSRDEMKVDRRRSVLFLQLKPEC